MEQTLLQQLESLAESLTASHAKLPVEVKLKTAELILRLMRRRKGFGLFVILGWHRRWHRYIAEADIEQDIYDAHPLNIMRLRPEDHPKNDVATTVHFDGAILINARGVIVHSGVVVEGMRPSVVARKLNPGKFRDLSEQFGFETKVHTRHLSAIAASYVFKGTTVFTVSEENDAFHVFEGGRIVHRA